MTGRIVSLAATRIKNCGASALLAVILPLGPMATGGVGLPAFWLSTNLVKSDGDGTLSSKQVPFSRFPRLWILLPMAAWAVAITMAQIAITSQSAGVRGKSMSKPYSDTPDATNPIHETTGTRFLI